MVRVVWADGRSAVASALKVGAPLAPLGDAKIWFAVVLLEFTPVPPLATATTPVTFPAVVAVPAVVALVAVAALPDVLTLMVAGNDSVTAPVLALTFTWFAVPARLVTPVLLRVTVLPSATVPPPDKPVPAETVTELFAS